MTVKYIISDIYISINRKIRTLNALLLLECDAVQYILDHTKHDSPLAFYLKVNRKEIPWIIFNAVLYGLGTTAVVMLSYFLGESIDALNENQSVSLLIWAMIIAALLGEAFYRLGHICEIFIEANIRSQTKKALFDYSRSLHFDYFASRFAGEIAHKVSMCATGFEKLTNITTNGIAENTVLLIVSTIALGLIHPYYALFLFLWGVVFAGGVFLFAKHMDIRAGEWAHQETLTTGKLVDTYSNINTVKVYGSESHSQSAHAQIDKEKKAYISLGKWDVAMFHFQGLCTIFLIIGLIGVSANLYTNSIITTGAMVAIAGIGFRLYGAVWSIGPYLTDFIRYRGEVRQNLEELMAKPDITNSDNLSHLPTDTLPSIEYRDIRFAYEDRTVLNNFSLSIKPGEKVGIVGLSGAGKTTFANLLLRFYDVQSGEVLFNDKNVKHVDQDLLRSQVSYISQDTALFHTTIAENIGYGSTKASQKDILEAAKIAYADKFIDELPNKYESVVGDRGIKLSGGQRQRIAIARAVLANRPLILLDEATSALDSDSEQKIQKSLEVLMENKTVIAIAHRLSTLSQMDRIIFLENGRIAESGSHKELLSKNGKYASLWKLQSR
jgi:ATP-binding cassette subfamily B protein